MCIMLEVALEEIEEIKYAVIYKVSTWNNKVTGQLSALDCVDNENLYVHTLDLLS